MTERLDAYMARAAAAYYATHDPFRDFTTAPEISQVFGEVLGLWAAVTWDNMGRPDPVVLAEAGPGRGTLMADALRAIERAMPAFRAALRLHLVETSPRLRTIQAARLPDPTWHDRVESLPDGPLILLANEFLDALPIRQFVRRGDGWAEHHVGAAGLVEVPVLEAPLDEDPSLPEGTVVEQGDIARTLVRQVSARLVRWGGAALFPDYGPEQSGPGDSLQAIADGRPADPFTAPGQADITAHVDFAALARVARDAGAAVHGPVPQGLFLARLGLFQRTERLASRHPPKEALRIMESARRLTEPNRMGRLFKAMALSGPHMGSTPLAGFEAE